MRVVPINEAEAIIEPFWDGGTVDHVTPKRTLLDEYRVNISKSTVATVSQSWSSLKVSIDKAIPDRVAVVLERDCELNIEGYDVFRIFAPIPEWVCFSAMAVIDGVEKQIYSKVMGKGINDEYDGSISGNRMTKLTIEFMLTDDRAAGIDLYWFGLANKIRQQKMEAIKSPYNSTWTGFIEPSAEIADPEIGIFFDSEELKKIKQKVKTGYLKNVYTMLRDSALKDMELNPEQDIGEFVPKEDRRWCRNRDMKRVCTAEKMERLAFVGLVEGNIQMSLMAVRMALSAAHNKYWCESIMGTLPGTTWHHCSFTEEVYSRACGLVLDWAGFCLTPHGKQFLRDTIVIKGLSRIESDFKRNEYLRYMNQGLVFSSGRILALLSLTPAYPRYRSLIDEAAKDLNDMLEVYIQEDGGIIEGPHYWEYTFEHVMPLLFALSRYYGKTFGAYVSDAVKKSGQYLLSTLSIVGNGNVLLPLNDSLMGEEVNPGLVAAFAKITDDPMWRNLYAASIENGKLTNDLYHIFYAPDELGDVEPVISSRFTVMPYTGEVSSIRSSKTLGFSHFHLSSGPTPKIGAHCHGDKGSFIIEAAGEALAIDMGRTHYGSAELAFVSYANRHNVLCPESEDGSAIQQALDMPGGKLISALEDRGVLLLSCDNTAAWEKGLFTKNLRHVFSPTPDLFILEDSIEMQQARPMSFRLNSNYRIEIKENETWVKGNRAWLRIVPINWASVKASTFIQGITCDEQPVNHLKLVTPASKTHRLFTAIQILPAGAGDEELWDYSVDSSGIRALKQQVHVDLKFTGAEEVVATLFDGETSVFEATCCAGKWQI